jgi:CheY-like chemotaxis protein
MQLSAVASLAAASTKTQANPSETDIQNIVDAVQHTAPAKPTSDAWRNSILWVDDRPDNNKYERKAFEAMGLKFTLALSTNEALDILSKQKYSAIISDMGRREGPREGYVLLDALRQNNNATPFFIYAGSNAPEHKAEAREHGGQGSTNNGQELFQMVTKSVIKRNADENG